MNVNLQEIANRILERGPHRVLISPAEGVPSRQARELFGVEPDIVFIRTDGWTLGAPSRYERIAFQMWRGLWIGFLRKPNRKAQAIAEYEQAAVTR